jgi:hypothetical protein
MCSATVNSVTLHFLSADAVLGWLKCTFPSSVLWISYCVSATLLFCLPLLGTVFWELMTVGQHPVETTSAPDMLLQ